MFLILGEISFLQMSQIDCRCNHDFDYTTLRQVCQFMIRHLSQFFLNETLSQKCPPLLIDNAIILKDYAK
jgi:hypothetical protein